MAVLREEPTRAWILKDTQPVGEGVATIFDDGTLFRAHMEILKDGVRRVRMVPVRVIKGTIKYEAL